MANDDRLTRRLAADRYVPAQPAMRPANGSFGGASVAHPATAHGPGASVAHPATAPGYGEAQDDYDGAFDAPSVAHPATGPAAPHTVEFSRAYQAHGEPVRRVTFRKPVTRDIKQAGNPIKATIGADGRLADLEIKWNVVAQYVAMLSDPPLPPSTVDSLEYEDLDACAGVIAGFFVRTA